MNLSLLHNNQQDLDLLDWNLIISDLSSHASLEKTRQDLFIPPRALDINEIELQLIDLDRYLATHDEFNAIFQDSVMHIPSHTSGFQNIRDIAKGKFFDCSELNSIALFMECYNTAFKHFTDFHFSENLKIGPEIYQKFRRHFLSQLREFVDRSGQPHYDRHPLLKKLYAEIIDIENDLRISIQKIAKSDEFSSRLQLDQFDIINDRYVLAIRSDSFNSDLGPIVARSNSGMTLFVEPYEIRIKSNKRIHLLAEIESIILKLTIGLSEMLHPHFAEISRIAEFVSKFDLINCKANYSALKGLQRPQLSDKKEIDLSQIFHPLVANPVKNNFSLSQKHKGMIISGPNTGGKTVVLKTVAICNLFLHMGLYVPASNAIMFPFDHLYYFSHDHQNLQAGLSSFASEAKYYLDLLHSLGDNNLILIDEIFNSTSSEEASALAIAFLDELHRISQSKIVLSTHHQVLKTFMHARTDYISSHVGFDFETNLPTYKLIIGEPGSSLAFKIFDNLQKKFSYTSNISEHAKKLLDSKQVTYESLLLDLDQKKNELEKVLHQNSMLNKELKNQKRAMEGVLHLEKEKLISEFQRKLKTTLNSAQELFDEIRQDKITSQKQLENRAHILKSQIQSSPKPQLKPTDDQIEKYSHFKEIDFEDIQIDQTLFALNIGKNVKVAQVNPKKKEVQVKHGSLLVWLPWVNLRLPSGAQPVKKAPIINIQREVLGKIEVDCRGMRLEEFQKICDKAIQDLYDGQVPFVTLVHGHGTGILKNWLREHLRREHPQLKWENIEGNDGCTKIST